MSLNTLIRAGDTSWTPRRKLRKYTKTLFSESVFDKKTVQALLNFVKRDSTVIDNLGSIIMEYDYNSAIGNALFFSGYFEEKEIVFFLNKLSQDNEPVILDVGANIGLHTIKWAKAFSKVKIFSFEPSPNTRNILERNIVRNEICKKVTIVPQAVSNVPGNANFLCCEDDAYSSLKDTRRKKIVSSLEVSVTTIDEFVKNNSLE